MNFCGEYDDQVEIQDTKVSGTVLCGPCAKDDADHLDDVFSDDDDDGDDDDGINAGKAPLDVIEETIENKKTDDEEDEDEDDKEALVRVLPSPGRSESTSSASSNPGMNTTPSRASSAADSSTTTPVLTSRASKCLDASTPSPIYLNPMSDDDWNGPARQTTIKSDLCFPSLELPMHSPSTNLNRLVQRLEGGFRVQFYHPGQSTKESVVLYLDQERNKVCLQTDEEKKEEEVNFWLEIPMEKILRIEMGGKGRTLSSKLNAFAILVSQDSRIVYYDFVTSSPLERELIVSTLASVIDRLEISTVEGEKKNFAGEDDADNCDTSLVEQKFSSIVKSLEDQSRHSATNSGKVFDDRSICSAPARSASLAERLVEKKFSSIVRNIEGKRQHSPSISEGKSFSSFKDRASHTLSEKRTVSSSAKSVGADSRTVSFNSRIKEIQDLKQGTPSKEKKNPVSTKARARAAEKRSQAIIKSIEERKQRIMAEKRVIFPIVEAVDSDEQKEHNLNERESLQILSGVDGANRSRSTDDEFDDPARILAEKEEECVVLDDVKDEQGGVTIIEDDEGDNSSSKIEKIPEEEEDLNFGGTHDAPIPCSPSLEEFSPRRSTQLFNDRGNTGTEATLVIHLEGLQDEDEENYEDKKIGDDNYKDKELSTPSTPRSSPVDLSQEGVKLRNETQQPSTPKTTPKSSTTKESKDRPSSSRSVASNRSSKSKAAKDVESPNHKIQREPRPTPETMHLTGSFGGGPASNSPHKNEVSLAVSARAEDLMVEFASSSGHLASAWCADSDICTSALKDITDTCTSVFELKQAEATCTMPTCTMPTDFSEQQALIEEYVANALDAPSAVYSYLIEGEKWSETKTSDEEAEPKLPGNGRVRNRSSVSNAQALRLRRLRSEMTFAAALKRSKDNMQYVQTTKSFDDAKVLGSKTDSTEAVKQFHSSALLESVVGTMMFSDTEQVAGEEEVAYYDSDPEDARPRTLHKRCPRQAQAELSSEEGANGGIQKGKTLSSAFDKVKSTKRVSKKLDEETIVQMVQTMTNERMTLIWHPTQREKSNRPPLCVKVWIEAGVCLVDGTFVLPKLCWSKVMDKEDSDDNAAGIGRLLGRDEPDKVDLLDICRVHATKSVDRQRHPFADARKSFFIETQGDAILFEALTYEERDRIVYGLKLVIARLASLLMLRDVRAAEEFFGAVAPPVPGEAPQWVQGGSKPSASEQQHPPGPPGGGGGLLPTMNK